MPEPRPNDEPKSFEEIMADQTLNLFFTRILLKKNLEPLQKFVQDRENYTNIDPLEIPQLRRLLGDPITGPIHEIQQWRFKDRPYMFAFRGWRVDQYPQPDMSAMWRTYEAVYNAFRDNEQEGAGAVTVDQLKVLLDQLSSIYDQVAEEIDPRLKKVWVENNIKQYEQWEGQKEGLPGRLTPDYVDTKLAELRDYRKKLTSEPGGLREQTITTPPSAN